MREVNVYLQLTLKNIRKSKQTIKIPKQCFNTKLFVLNTHTNKQALVHTHSVPTNINVYEYVHTDNIYLCTFLFQFNSKQRIAPAWKSCSHTVSRIQPTPSWRRSIYIITMSIYISNRIYVPIYEVLQPQTVEFSSSDAKSLRSKPHNVAQTSFSHRLSLCMILYLLEEDCV